MDQILEREKKNKSKILLNSCTFADKLNCSERGEMFAVREENVEGRERKRRREKKGKLENAK